MSDQDYKHGVRDGEHNTYDPPHDSLIKDAGIIDYTNPRFRHGFGHSSRDLDVLGIGATCHEQGRHLDVFEPVVERWHRPGAESPQRHSQGFGIVEKAERSDSRADPDTHRGRGLQDRVARPVIREPLDAPPLDAVCQFGVGGRSCGSSHWIGDAWRRTYRRQRGQPVIAGCGIGECDPSAHGVSDQVP